MAVTVDHLLLQAASAPDGKPERPNGASSGPSRGASSGYTLAAAVLIGLGLGMFLDHRYGSTPKFTIGCSLAGIVIGFYHVVREAYKP